MTTVRRPRIEAELAARLNEIRSPEETFEGYVNYILAEYVARHDENEARAEEGEVGDRLHDFVDPGGAFCYINRLDGGWSKDRYKDVIAGLVIDATDQGFDALGVYITPNDARALRDTFTELLGEVPRSALGAKGENQP